MNISPTSSRQNTGNSPGHSLDGVSLPKLFVEVPWARHSLSAPSVGPARYFVFREIAFLGSSFTTHFYSLAQQREERGACLPSALLGLAFCCFLGQC